MNKHTDENQEMEQLTLDSFLEIEDEAASQHRNNHNDISIIKTPREHRKKVPSDFVNDFIKFMDYIVHNQISLTKTMEHISTKHLPAINEQLELRAEHTTNYTKQENYPAIHLFYHLALNSHLIELSGDAGKASFHVTERWKIFQDLTDTEKYFHLLEAFWVDLDWAELLGTHHNPIHHFLPEVFTKLLVEKSANYLYLGKDSLIGRFTNNWNYFFLYLDWLGIWVCDLDNEAMAASGRKSAYIVNAARLTPFGKQIVPVLLHSRDLQKWNIALRRDNGEANPLPGSPLPEETKAKGNRENGQNSLPFHKAFSALFSQRDLYKSLPRVEQKFTTGTHTFTVTYSSHFSCSVVLSSQKTMQDLHNMIMRAFAFDDDHLYSFFMDGKKWSNHCIVAPMDDSGNPSADECTIGSLGLRPGQRFLYLFDYGDEWLFNVKVAHIDASEHNTFKPYIEERKGEGPEQYPD